MMDTNHKAVHSFLNDVLGYGRIADLMNGEKPLGMPMKEFLDGTIFRGYATWVMGEGLADYVHRKMPGIPKIMVQDEVLAGFKNPSKTPDYILDAEHPYTIRIHTLFKYDLADEVEDYVKDHVQPIFPDSKLHRKATIKHPSGLSYGFKISVDTDYFNMFVEGCNTPKTVRLLHINFDASPDTVSDINTLVSRYYALIHKKKQPREVTVEAAVYLELARNCLSMQPSELSKALADCIAVEYVKEEGYKPGMVLDHPDLGRGLVVGDNKSLLNVMFPEGGFTRLEHYSQ